MLVWSNHRGMPHDVNIYRDESGWILATVWKNKVFPTLPALLSAMVRDNIVTAEDAESIRKTIETRCKQK